ncbi:MAG: 4-hydroxy-3-methylbut-2-enyl diphosphate reductase [Thermoanaerobaculaceae bacterium]|nr:4-hydroxy-3-methylbut-2-enyl diphosphate reductase [Thermoanaerobaculaceae bacterium]MDI9620528.1 4-hydroxy-3-methylbut-2-enyl diphosphate reductase [Acidobacteriota bacterium]
MIRRAARYGFCSGVRVADIRVRRFAASGRRGAILGQVVHNERVVEDLARLGVRTVESLDEVVEPVVVFSAHGVPPSLHRLALERGLEVLDTTCRFVYDIHHASQRALAAGAHLVFVGNPGHREVIGYTHDLDPDAYHVVHTLADVEAVDWSRYESITVFYQTTLNAEEYEEVVQAIERANPATRRADTICYATKENQAAARELAEGADIDLVLVVGGRHSANTRHLFDICARLKPSHLIQGAADIDPAWLSGANGVGLTAGASTPDYVMDEVEARLIELGGHPPQR